MSGTGRPLTERVATLAIVAVVEAVSLVVLFVNLATVHVGWLASLLGPVHGLAYLAGIALAFSGPYGPTARWLSVIPGVGAGLTAHRGSA